MNITHRWGPVNVTFSGVSFWDHNPYTELVAYLARIESKLDRILHEVLQGEKMAAVDLTALQNQVAKNTSVTASALTLIQGLQANVATLSKQLADAIAAGDPAAIQATQAALDSLAAQIQSSDDALAGAV